MNLGMGYPPFEGLDKDEQRVFAAEIKRLHDAQDALAIHYTKDRLDGAVLLPKMPNEHVCNKCSGAFLE